VLTLHNIESALSSRCAKIEPQRLKRVFWRLESKKLAALERQWLSAVEAVVVMSDTDRRAALRMAPNARVCTVENGVDTDEYETGVDGHRDRSVVFTGSLGYPPNADGVMYFLDEVWPCVRQAAPDAVCVIVGRDPFPSLLARHGKNGVMVTGPVEDVRPYLARAGAVVVPLRAGGGTRLKILEAMAAGAAIVSTRLGAEGLDVESGRELLIADEPAAFARATIQLLTDGALRRRFGIAARRRAEERYDWRFAADALDAVYRTAS
jgi:glycosyltransferase involved in cell wall biosynthesis